MERRPEPVEAATDYVARTFPEARCAVVSGSVMTPARTATSDLDVVILLDGPPAPYRHTTRHLGWVVEAFVQTDASLEHFYAKDLARRQPSLARMVATGTVVADRTGDAARVQADARRLLEAGPRPLGAEETRALRYALTDQVDDLVGCDRPGELPWIAAHLATLVADLALGIGGHWTGGAKWLPRELADLDADLAARLTDALVAAPTDRGPLVAVAREVLDRAGGPLQDGYRLAATLPS